MLKAVGAEDRSGAPACLASNQGTVTRSEEPELLQSSNATFLLPLHFQESVTCVAIEMHNTLEKKDGIH